MANKTLFNSLPGKLAPKADAVNEAGGTAYAFEARHALAQYAATGTLNGTFYATAQDQLETILALCDKVEPEFIARTALEINGATAAALVAIDLLMSMVIGVTATNMAQV